MSGFSTLDLVALAWFALAWAGYGIAVELTPLGRDTLNHRMDRYRDHWTKTMLRRDLRIVDTQIMASLQNGTAFFASTSLLAVGAAPSRCCARARRCWRCSRSFRSASA